MKARKPKWYESNIIAREGLVPAQWRVVGSNREYIRIWNKSTGAAKEIDVGGKIRQKAGRFDPSEGLARYMDRARKSETPAAATARESM